MPKSKTNSDRHTTKRKPVNLEIEWHELLDRIQAKTGRTKLRETQMAIYQRAKILGIDKLPNAPFDDA